jgi:hypothetical protein
MNLKINLNIEESKMILFSVAYFCLIGLAIYEIDNETRRKETSSNTRDFFIKIKGSLIISFFISCLYLFFDLFPNITVQLVYYSLYYLPMIIVLAILLHMYETIRRHLNETSEMNDPERKDV